MANENKLPDIPRMTKTEFMAQYEKYKDSENLALNLSIHMPDDSIEIIFNSKGHNKVKYINETYDENLAHKNSEQIFIVDVQFFNDKIHEFNFSNAVQLLKHGKRLSRRGWNGKDQFIYFFPKCCYEPHTKAAGNYCRNDDGLVPYREYIAIKTTDGTVVPWVASQTDILADDWYAVYN